MGTNITGCMAVAALLMSFFSVVFAFRSAKSASDSATCAIDRNRLSERNERLLIYKALQNFHSELRKKGSAMSASDVLELEDAANISRFFFPAPLSAELTKIVGHANQYLEFRVTWASALDESDVEGARRNKNALLALGGLLRGLCVTSDARFLQFLSSEEQAT